MIVINEYLPNPTGNDAAGEFVELKNTGTTPVDLRGWSLTVTGLKKRVAISGAIPADGYLVLWRKDTKLVLKNADEGIALYDATGKLVDESSFAGTAPEGKSFNRVDTAGVNAANFVWSEPTPGAANKIELNNGVTVAQNPIGIPLNTTSIGAGSFIVAMLGLAVLLIAAALYSIKVNDDLSELFFGRNKATR